MGAMLFCAMLLAMRLPMGLLGILSFPVVIAGIVYSRRTCLFTLGFAALASFATITIDASQPLWKSGILILLYMAAAWIAVEIARQISSSVTQSEHDGVAGHERFSELVESTPGINIVMGANSAISNVSPGVHNVLGYTAEELLGKRAVDYVHPDDRQAFMAELSAAFGSAASAGVSEFRFRNKDGSSRILEIARGARVTENSPEPCLNMTARDISGHRNAEHALQSADQFNRDIIANVAQGIVVLDRELRCVVWNHAMEYATGVTAVRALGQSALEGLHRYLPRDGSLLLSRALKGDVVTAPDFSYSSNNPAHPLTWVSCTYGPNRNGTGEIMGVIGVLRDVTERVISDEKTAALYTETAEALERERRYNEIARLVSSSLELSEVLNNIARITGELFDTAGVVFSLAQTDGSMEISPESYQQPSGVKNVSALLNEPLQQVMSSGESQLIEDYEQSPNARLEGVNAGLHSCLVAPLTAGTTRLGAVALYSIRPLKRFSERDLTVLEMVGRQAGLAIQRARLVEDAQRMAQEAETLRQAGAAVASTLRLHETFERILQQLARVVPYDSASIQLLRDGFCEVVDVHGWLDPLQVIGIRFPVPGNNPNTAVIQERRSVIRNDVDFSHIPVAGDIHSWMGVPLLLRDDVIGMLALDGLQSGHFIPEHARLAQAFADQVAVAIENAGLFERVQQLARTDDLTGLNNRRRFFELAEHAFQSAVEGHYAVGVLMIDIDRFKRVNDAYGHVTGDEVLQEVSQRCRRALRGIDVLARYGGEEFVAVLAHVTLADAMHAAERLRLSIMSECIATSGSPLSITVSVGVDCCEDCAGQLEMMLIHADQALYTAKHAGGNQVTAWEPAHTGA